MLNGILSEHSRQAQSEQRGQRQTKRQVQQWNIFETARLWIVIIMLAASSCRCRASFLRHERSAAFLISSIGRKERVYIITRQGYGSRVSLFSNYARLQSEDDDDEMKPRSRPPLPPPPMRARPMPPSMESYESSNIYTDFPDFDVTAADEFGAYDYYDPTSTDEESYGFFTNNNDDEETEVLSSPPSLDAATLRLPDLDAPETMKASDAVMPPVDDAYMNSQEQEDVPNPHNYWDNDTPDADDATAAKDDAIASSPPSVEAVPDTIAKDEASKTSETLNLQVKATFPTPTLPPRAAFASQPPKSREEVYRQASSGDAITSEVDMLTTQLLQLQQDIYAQNNNKEFNIKSTKQVSQVLFGEPGQSTNKETLEAMGGAGNRMADLILQYRSLSRKIARLKKKKEHKANGTLVQNVSTTSRSNVATKDSKPKAALSNASNNDVVEGDPLLLVDASAYIFRAYYSMPPLHRADGMPIGALLGFCNMINRLVLSRMLEGECPRLVLVFDAKGKTFRHDMYDDYKANRKECPMDLIPQFDLIREAAEAYGIQQLEAPYFEADDVIATLATMALNEGVDANILSGDKDLMQLITPQDEFPAVEMVDPMTMSRVSHDVVVDKWGVTPDKLGDVLALAGDSADNVPGVPGIGPKIAATLIGEYGSLDELLEQVDSVKQKGRREKLKDNVEKARLSRQLVDLERAIPLDKMTFPENITGASELRMAPMDGERLLAFYETMGMKDMKRRVEARLNRKKAVRATGKKYNNRRPKAEIPKPDDYKDVPF